MLSDKPYQTAAGTPQQKARSRSVCSLICTMDFDAVVLQPKSPQEIQIANGLFSSWLSQDDPNCSSGLNDVALQLILDPEGFFVAEVNGEVVSTITAINYDDNYAFIGFFRTDKPHRGKGIGGKLWRTGLAHCGERMVGLYASLGLVDYYKRDGFVQFCKVICYKVENLDRFKIPVDSVDKSIIEVEVGNVRDVIEFDRKYAPAPREKFMEAWILQPGSVTLACVCSGVVLGYGVIRRTFKSRISRIGPLYAANESLAEKLVVALLRRAQDASHVLYEAFNANPSTGRFAKFLKAEWLEDGEAMYRNGTPKFDVNGVFAVTSGAID